MPIIRVWNLDDPRLGDFSHTTDVALKKASLNPAQHSEHGIYLAESQLVFERALASGHVPRAVLSLENAADAALAALERHGFAAEIPVFVGPDEVLSGLTGYSLHRGMIGSMQRPAPRPASELIRDARRVVIVENVVDPTNLGAIFRSAGAIGADAILLSPRSTDPLYRRAIRVSMGTVLQVPWGRIGEWDEAHTLLHDAGFSIAALALTDDAVSLRDYARTLPERLALVLGTEGDGLTAEAIAAADVVVQIPMKHGIDSLNVAAASAVAMWAVAE